MHNLLRLVVALMICFAPLTASRAGLNLDFSVPTNDNLQLVVMEAEGCVYCDVFRRDVLPKFEASEQGKEMRVRFVDVNDIAKTSIELQSPIEILPTFVVIKNNAEVGRIPGYMGMEDFFQSIKYLLSSGG